MKKKVIISILIAAIILFIVSLITNYIDGARVRTGYEPKYCLKTINYDGNKVTYWGLGYKVIRYVGVSPKEPYQNNIGVKMGNWFMTYELDENAKNEEKREYIKTYNVIEKLDITDETGIYNYYIIKQFQDNEPVLIKVSNNYKLEKNKNYEFMLYGVKKDNIKYTHNEIFDNFEIKNIIETDKIGLEQIQEL